MAPLRALIVDDETIARTILSEELEQFDDVEVVGEAEDGISALASIRDLSPDLIFIDLQMPGMGGLDVIRRLPSAGRLPMVVIVTAFDQYAIQAFEAGAIDYLLKPIGQDRLAQAVERAIRMRGKPSAVAEQLAHVQEIADPEKARSVRKIVARAGEEYLLLGTDEVLGFEADGELVWILTAKKRYLATQPLKTIQEKLKDTSFRRIHRKALVNIEHVRKMSALSSQRWLVTLTNGHELIVSKRQARHVRQLLSW
ncbi:MAG TPA: response regulator [Bryobacteraceae bacterium]|nr:response regulator [Bryobacteraceae bacterium]